jgi:PucR C-terminal helix-turn-helix domain
MNSLETCPQRVIRRAADVCRAYPPCVGQLSKLRPVRALVRYVSNFDTHAESALKVIGYFDALVEHRATLEGCVRAAAGLSQCNAGLRDDASSWSLRFNHRGTAMDGTGAPTTTRVIRVGDRDVGEVWLERDAGAEPLDELVVERMALAAGILWHGSTRPSRSATALIELVVTNSTSPEERGRALRLLGFHPERPLSLVAVATDDTDKLADALSATSDAIQDWSSSHEHHVIRSAVLGNIGSVLMQVGLEASLETSDRLPSLPRMPDVRVGVVPRATSADAAVAWTQAQTAARFSGILGFGQVVDYGQLGSLAVLAALPQTNLDSNRDLKALAGLASSQRGRVTIETLQTCLSSSSLRAAATEMHLHHSSVSHRLRLAETALGLQINDPQSRLRAEVALILWQLSSR